MHLPALRTSHRAHHEPVNPLQIHLAGIVEQRFKGDVIVLRADILSQRVDPPQIGPSCDRHAEPRVIQLTVDVQQIGPLGQKQELMLRVGPHFGEHFLQPFRLPDTEVAHAREQKNLRAWLFHQPQLSRIKLRL